MPKNFDTNPLDPGFPERARAKAARAKGGETPFKTAEFPASPSSITEDETRRFSDPEFQSYFEQKQAAMYQPPQPAKPRASEIRLSSGSTVPEKWLIGLPYLPFTLGLVAGLILLFVIPKGENRLRFHSAQGLAAHVGILIVSSILGIVSEVSGVAELGSFVFFLVTTIMLIVFAIKAWRGKPVHIAAIDDLTNWLEEKIGPLK